MNLKMILLALTLASISAGLAGCAAFEQSPEDLQKKISNPTGGHFVERNPEKPF